MRVSDFDYTLPPELIAQQPVEPRDAARLLLLDRRGEHTRPEEHLHVRDLPDLLRAGDLLVANRSRVLPARVLRRLAARGVTWATVVLHVGVDTLRPITHDDPSAHRMHREWYTVPPNVVRQVADTRTTGGRVVAVGTTVVRALESWVATGEPEGWTDLFIVPGHHFGVVDSLLTNFHLPRSTLLLLVRAVAGREPTLAVSA